MLSPSSSHKELTRQNSSGLIQRLGQENQTLKEELADVLKSLATMPHTQQAPQLQQRLNDFKARLQQAISRDGLQRSESGTSVGVGWEREKAQLVEHY